MVHRSISTVVRNGLPKQGLVFPPLCNSERSGSNRDRGAHLARDQPFELNREHRSNARTRPPDSRKGRSTCSAKRAIEEDIKNFLVDLKGFEPLTSSMPWKRAPNCATGPRAKCVYVMRIPQ